MQARLTLADVGDVNDGHDATLGASLISAAAPRAATLRRDPLAAALLAGRLRRIVMLLIGVWALNAADLAFTLIEANSSHFIELNPIAANLLGGPPYFLVAYKLCLLALGTTILFCFRRHAVSELGCWFLLATCTYVLVRWYAYYHYLLEGEFNGVFG